jgi:hypothetical protein
MTGETLEEDIPTLRQARVAAITMSYLPAAFISECSVHPIPLCAAEAVTPAEPSDQADPYSDQKGTTPTIPGRRTEAQCSRKSTNTFPSPQNSDASLVSQVKLPGSAEPFSEVHVEASAERRSGAPVQAPKHMSSRLQIPYTV